MKLDERTLSTGVVSSASAGRGGEPEICKRRFEGVGDSRGVETSSFKVGVYGVENIEMVDRRD